MIIIKNLKYIPLSYWLSIVGVIAVMLAIVYLTRRRQKPIVAATSTEYQPFSLFTKALRLFLFGMLALFLVSYGILLIGAYQVAIGDTVPTPSQVDVPTDLPFAVDEITFLSEDGLKIAGWFVPPENGATIILLHGYGGNRLAMRWHAERLTAAGYGVLMYDERASGESEGEYRSYGWEDAADVGGAVIFLQEQVGEQSNIGIAGCSMGGQIALQGIASYPEIGAVWADGPSVIRAGDIRPADNLLFWIIRSGNYFIDWMYHWRIDIELPTPMLELLPQIAPRPIMLVGGGQPRSIYGSEAPQMSYYAEYAGENAEVWIIKEVFHCDGPGKRPEEYATKMVDFFDLAFGIDE